jgi:hypothetical protein
MGMGAIIIEEGPPVFFIMELYGSLIKEGLIGS